MPSESASVCPRLKHRCTLPKFSSAIKLFKLSRFRDRHGYSQHTENQRHELRPVSIRSFDVREETYKNDSILLRHMDDVVGTGLEEHLMSDFEHMKTSLYLTDVVVLRNEG